MSKYTVVLQLQNCDLNGVVEADNASQATLSFIKAIFNANTIIQLTKTGDLIVAKGDQTDKLGEDYFAPEE
ncbi:MAG: hypothetical protein COB14_04320 [Alphaproteobacteria bacterium]|nr:MAG: hypothetical protein COB14_04320 [Alphaproteobacteria bacterium]